MATVQVNLSSKLLEELTDNSTVKAYALFFEKEHGTNIVVPNWTELTAASASVTLDGGGQKLYFIIQSNSNAADSVQVRITKEADISPVGASTSADKLNYRYDSFEVSFTPATADVGNLTDIVGFGIPMAISVGYGPSAGAGATPTSSATRGYAIDGGTVDASGSGSGLWKDLYDIGGPNSIQFFSATSGGYATTQPRLAIAPATAIGNNVSGTNYSVGQWAGYTSSLYASGSQATSAGAPGQIQIAGYYTGGNDAAQIWHNGGYYAYGLTYDSATSSFILTPGATSQIRGTITLHQDDLNNSIYTTLGNATVDGFDNGFGVNSATLTMNTGYNNAWGTVLRDFLGGFTAGYWNTTATSLNPALSGTIDLNKEWNQDPTYAFGGLVSAGSAGAVTRTVAPLSGGIAYDEYAKIFFRETNSYGNGYSDFLGRSYSVGPLISVWDQVPVPPGGTAQNAHWIDVTLFSDTDTVGSALSGYTAPVIHNYVSGGYTAVTGVNSGGPLHQLDFSVGTMTLKPDAEVALVFKNAGSGGGDIRVPLVVGGGSSGFASSGTYGANYTISASGSGYAAAYTGAANAGFINIKDMPIASGSGVAWYQIEVGSGGVVSKTFNLYETVSSGQILNPAYSGQAGALAIDGLAGVAANGSATDQFVANNAGGGQVSVNFQDNIVNSIDPSLMTVVPLPSGPLQDPYAEPSAPVVGWRPGSTGPGTAAFRQMYDVWSAQSFISTSSGTVQTSTPQTVYNGGLVFGWNGADSVAQQQQYSLSTPNYYLNRYTNKIGGGNAARLVFTAVSGALPSSGLSSSGTGSNTIYYTVATADNEGTWQTVTPVQFANGTYTVQMQEFATAADAGAGVSALNGASDVQSFTVAQGAVISNSTLTVSSGQTSAGLIVESGGLVIVAGGTTSALLVSSGGRAQVSSGSDTGAFILGGIHEIGSGAAASGMTIYSGGSGQVHGSSFFATIRDGGFQYVGGGGSATSALAISTTVSSGGNQYVLSGGRTGSAYLGSNSQTQYSAGAIVSGGGIQVVVSGGSALGTLLGSGGTQYVSGGAQASGTTVQSGATQIVGGVGAVASAFNTGVDSGGTLTVLTSGTASSALMSGGVLHATSQGTTTAATLQSGSVQKVWASGSASGTTVQSGAHLYSYDSGHALAPTTLNGGFTALWGSGTVGSGGAVAGVEDVKSGAVHSGLVVNSGGNLHVHLAGSAVGTTVDGGGYLKVWGSGSLASSSKLAAINAFQYVYSGATESGSNVISGGQIAVWGSGSLAAGTKVDEGGAEYVYSGASASGVNVYSGGNLWAWDAGTTVTETNVYSGGSALIHGGATVGNTYLYGGKLDVFSGGLVSSSSHSSSANVTIVGANGGTVKFTHDVTGLQVSGFTVGQGAIEFADIAWQDGGAVTSVWSQTTVSSGTNPGSGTLTLTSGGLHAVVTLFGTWAAASEFSYTTDGHVGTLVRDVTSGTDPVSLLSPV